MTLTPKQDKFAQLVADGHTYTDAYTTAYNHTGKPTTANRHAHELANDAKIKARISELKAQLEAVNLWTRTESVKALIEALEVAREERNVSGIVAAVKELNAMHGFNAPQQVQLSGQMDLNKIIIETVIIPYAQTDD